MPREEFDRLDRQRVRRRVRVAADVALDRLRERVHAALRGDLRRKAQRQLRVHQRHLRRHELVPEPFLELRLLVGQHRDARAFGARARRRRRGDEEERRLFEITLPRKNSRTVKACGAHRRDDLARVERAAAADRRRPCRSRTRAQRRWLGRTWPGSGSFSTPSKRRTAIPAPASISSACASLPEAAQRRAARHQQRAPAVSPADLAEPRKRPRPEQNLPGKNQVEIHACLPLLG